VNGCAAGLAEAPELVTFSVNGTINLTSEPFATRSVAIRGPDASKLTLSGQGASRVFRTAPATARGAAARYFGSSFGIDAPPFVFSPSFPTSMPVAFFICSSIVIALLVRLRT
jgi:hypothetical protein